MSAAGWIKLHRQLQYHPRFKDHPWTVIWIWMLFAATHRERSAVFDGARVTLSPGQFIAGRSDIVRATGVPENVCRRVIAQLIADGQINQVTSRTSSLYTITNWDGYQTINQPPTNLSTNLELLQPMKQERNTGLDTVSPTSEPTNITRMVQEEDIYTELPPRFPKTPEEAIAVCMNAGIPPEFVTQTWTKAMGRGGHDSADCPIRNFIYYAKTEWGYELNRREQAKRTPSRSSPTYATQKQLELVTQEIKDIRNSAGTDAFGTFQGTAEQRERLKKLKAKQTELKQQLGLA